MGFLLHLDCQKEDPLFISGSFYIIIYKSIKKDHLMGTIISKDYNFSIKWSAIFSFGLLINIIYCLLNYLPITNSCNIFPSS